MPGGDIALVSVLGLIEVVQAGRDIQNSTYNGTGLMMGAILFLVVTIPLARLVDWLIAREKARTQRGGRSSDDSYEDPMLTSGGGVTI